MRFTLSLSFVLICLITYAQTTDKYPIFNEKPKKGIYVTFEEFKFNEPSITSGYSLKHETRNEEKWKGTKAYYPVKNNGSKTKIPKTVWGFSDGYEIFVFHDVAYFKLLQKENGFETYAHDKVNWDKVNAGEVIGYSLGGILGGTIAAASKDNKVKKVLNTKQRYCVDFDGVLKHIPTKGNFIDWNRFQYNEKRTITLIRGKAKELSQTVAVNFNEEIYNLAPKSFEEIEILIEDKTYQICLEGKKECLKANLIKNVPHYFHISNTKKKGLKVEIPSEDFVKFNLATIKRQSKRKKG